MKDVLVVGANGTTGRLIVRDLVARGYGVTGMVRDPGQEEEIRRLGAATVVADLTRPETLPPACAGCEAIVFAAGSKGRDLHGVDRDGAIRLIEAAEAAGVGRFVMLSSFYADHPDEGPEKIRPYLHAKRAADDHLRASGLDFTIVRPGWLTNEEGTGRIATAEHFGDEGGTISRADVADTLATSLEMPETVGTAFEVIAGETPIREALARLTG